MPKLADAEVVLHGLVVAMVEKRDYESKELTGYRATVVGVNGGAAVVNFSLHEPLPFAPLMSQVLWVVVSAPWSMSETASSGMSTRFVREVDPAYLINLGEVLESNAASFPVKS